MAARSARWIRHGGLDGADHVTVSDRHEAQATAEDRALLVFDAIHSGRMYSRRRHLYGRRRWRFARSYENLWPFADAWSAVATLASLADRPVVSGALSAFFDGLAAYRRVGSAVPENRPAVGFESAVVPPLGAGGDRYFDDNTWLGLAALRHHALTGEERGLELARHLLEFVTSGWSSQATWSHPGGIRWKEPPTNTSRNTCSNAPVAELAALVYEITGEHGALDWATTIYAWVRSALLGPDQLYLDRITPQGVVDPTVWTYNQGTMIGAGVLLHRITGIDEYLSDAVATARAAQTRFTLPVLMAQDAAFNAVYFRNLLLLDRVAPDSGYRASAMAYATEMWERVRAPRTGLFPRGHSPLNDTAPMLEIYALLAGAPPHP
jgi:hypothetical protein